MMPETCCLLGSTVHTSHSCISGSCIHVLIVEVGGSFWLQQNNNLQSQTRPCWIYLRISTSMMNSQVVKLRSALCQASIQKQSTLSAGSNQGIECDCVWEAAFMVHFIEELQCQLPLACLFAGGYETAVGNDTAFAPFVDHLLKHFHDLQNSSPSGYAIACILNGFFLQSLLLQYIDGIEREVHACHISFARKKFSQVQKAFLCKAHIISCFETDCSAANHKLLATSRLI